MKRIVHIDLDAFFASVEELLNPSLRGKPVIVGANPRGVVSSCNYEARKYGIHSAMPVVEARRKCPEGVFVHGRFGVYSQYSKDVFRVLERFSPHLEKTGIDEGYLDLTGTSLMHKRSYPEIIQKMRDAVKAETGLTISCGLGTTKIFAKIASKLAKPNGFFTVLPSRELEILHSLPVSYIPGVGPHLQVLMREYHISTIGQFASMDDSLVAERFGKTGLYLHMLAWNIDDREIDQDYEEQKSMSKDETLSFDTKDPALLERYLHDLTTSLLFRLRSTDRAAGGVHLKVKYANHAVRQKSLLLSRPSNVDAEIMPVLRLMLLPLLQSGEKVRQLGVRFTELGEISRQTSLFVNDERTHKVLEVTDALRRKFGFEAIGRGLSRALSHRSPVVYS